MRATATLILLALASFAAGQTAAPFPPLVYTYNPAESAPSSLLNAISTAGAPARSVMADSAGPDTATALVGAFPTTATKGPVTVPQLTSDLVLGTGASGEIKSTATRPPYTASGTINTSMAAAASSGASRVSSATRGAQGAPPVALAVGVVVTVVGMVAGAGVAW